MKNKIGKVLEALAKLKNNELGKDQPEGEVNLLSIAEKITRNREKGQ